MIHETYQPPERKKNERLLISLFKHIMAVISSVIVSLFVRKKYVTTSQKYVCYTHNDPVWIVMAFIKTLTQNFIALFCGLFMLSLHQDSVMAKWLKKNWPQTNKSKAVLIAHNFSCIKIIKFGVSPLRFSLIIRFYLFLIS